MKSALAGIAALGILGLLVSVSVRGAPGSSAAPKELAIQSQARNPWTTLEVNDAPNQFQFAVVSDNTGGRRAGVFGKAVTKLNLLQPQFVLSVGDLIDGYSEDPGAWALEWAEFEGHVEKLQMPFFFCVGNHDISNIPMRDEWKRKFGRTYYEFRYRDVLFLVIDTEDPPVYEDQKKIPYRISPAQQKWAAETLAKHADARWTFVIMHKPTWSYPGIDHREAGWTAVEESLAGRNYTVFAGHKHNYAKFLRKGMEYYMLATTGGGSKLRGLADGEFDHVTWITMKGDKPVISNILLEGVEPSDLRILPDPESQPKPAAK